MSDLVGQAIRGYELQEALGAGGFGAVYRAFQPAVRREVAIKIILPEHANQPDFIRRFETEAQLVARLEHLHIIPLYDYWRDPDGAFLVMRYLRGGSLRGSLRNGAWELGATARLLDQIAAALSVAHRNGIVHRDIKPDNILLDDDGNGYLADFGIAKDLTVNDDDDGESISGSLPYIAPEQIRAEPLTPQADLYSLGIVLYEVITGTSPFPDLTPSTLLKMHLFEPFPLVAQHRPDLPPEIDHVIQKATDKSPEQRFPSALSMAEAFRTALEGLTSGSSAGEGLFIGASMDSVITPAVHPLTLVLENPYKGLRAFQQADYLDFYGRDTLLQQLIARLEQPGESGRFLAVVGPSGSGKSSVVKAGLLPALRREAIPGSDRWFIVEMTPGVNPFRELGNALLSVAVNAPTSEQLQQDKAELVQTLAQILPNDDTELVLVIDQFEELFTLCENEKTRAQFLDNLQQAATTPNSRLRIVITLRADFYDRPLLHPAFGDLLRRYTEVVLPLGMDELKQAITGPAARVGLMIEAGLVEAIQQDIGEQPGALPLLQYSLTELYERRDGSTLTLKAYQDSGGVFGALARRADELYEGLDEPSRKAVRQLFLRMVTSGEGTEDTRRRVLRAELAGTGDENVLDSVIESFSRYRLLTLDRDPVTRSPTVEIAHEALIRTWARLRGWLNDSREDLRIQRLLAGAAAEWVKANRDASFLASGARLDQFVDWAGRTDLALNETERAYLNASTAEREAQRLQDEARKAREAKIARRAQNFGRAAAAAAVVGLIAVLLTIFSIAQANEAGNQRSTAVYQQQQALAQVAIAGQTLTPIPVTLNAVVTKIQNGNNMVESLRLAAAINVLLQDQKADKLPAVLLGVRALNTAYTTQADIALQQALDTAYTRRAYDGHSLTIYSVAYAPDGKTFVSGSGDSTVRLWDSETGQPLRLFTGHVGEVYAVAFAPDGKTVLSGGADQTVRLWDIATGKQLRQFAGHKAPVKSVAFAPDQITIVTAGDDATIRLWDINTGEQIRQFDGHNGTVWNAVYSPDGTMLASGGSDNTARLWDIETGQTLRTFTGHTGLIRSVAFAPDGKQLVTGSADKTIRLWDIATGKEVRQFTGHLDPVLAVAISPDGKLIASGGGALTGPTTDKTARVWDVATGQQVRQLNAHTFAIWAVAFSPDGGTILTGSTDKGVRSWEVETGQQRRPFFGSMAFSPDGKRYVTGSADKIARLWDTQSGRLIRTFEGHTDAVISNNFAPDGKTLVTGSKDTTIRLWDAATGQQVRVFNGHTGPVYSVVFAHDGKTFLSGSGDHTLRLWDVATGQPLRVFNGHTGGIFTIALSPDDRFALSGADDGTMRLWDVATGQEVREFPGYTAYMTSVAFSPDGKWALGSSGDNTVRLWDVATAKEIRRYTEQTYVVWSATFSPDGKLIVTGSDDRTARVWDVATGNELRQFIDRTPAVLVSFSPDSRLVFAGSQDMTARVWEVDYRDYLVAVCSHLYRDFTWEERLRYGVTDTQPTCPQFDLTATAPPYSSATWTPVATNTIPAHTALPALPASNGNGALTPQPSITLSPTITSSRTPTLIPVTLDWTPRPLPTLPQWTPIPPP